jgi:hypothetical protein
MTTFDELDQLPSDELRRRAERVAKRRLDIRFFWRMLEFIPEAEAASGELREGREDIQRTTSLLRDFRRTRRGELDEPLRPFFIDYLQRHS